MASTVLVTGGAGFIGSWTCELLVDRGYSVIIIDDFSSGSLDNLSRIIDRVVVVKGDICRLEFVYRVMRDYRVDAVIHLAAIVSVEEVYDNPFRGFYVNANGTLNLLEASRRLDIKKFVYASSAAVYGDPVKLPITEDHPLRPKNLYGVTKLVGEMLVDSYRSSYGLPTVVLRYFNVYGPRMKQGPYAGVVYNFVTRVLRDKPPIIYGDGRQTRDFVYVEDVALANIVALEKNVDGVYNIGSGKSMEIEKLANLILKLMGKEYLEPVYTEPRKGDIKHSYASIDKAIAKLGWMPSTDLLDGLRSTIEYFINKESR